jgi:hypothetical protein
MTISMYAASVPVLVRALSNLSGVLEKAAAHAEARKLDPAVLLNDRLYPDMFPLVRQVQIASDNAKGGAARLAGVQAPKYEDNETSFAELQARLDKTIAYLNTFTPEQFQGAEERPVVLTLRSGELKFVGLNYLLGYLLPNIFFHITTAYAILRHNGVELGKRDYLGRV